MNSDLAILTTIVQPLQCGTQEDARGIFEAEAAFVKVASAFDFVPREEHRRMYALSVVRSSKLRPLIEAAVRQILIQLGEFCSWRLRAISQISALVANTVRSVPQFSHQMGSLSNRALLVNNLLDLALYAGNRVVSALGIEPPHARVTTANQMTQVFLVLSHSGAVLL
jgi:hypothetical protein